MNNINNNVISITNGMNDNTMDNVSNNVNQNNYHNVIDNVMNMPDQCSINISNTNIKNTTNVSQFMSGNIKYNLHHSINIDDSFSEKSKSIFSVDSNTMIIRMATIIIIFLCNYHH